MSIAQLSALERLRKNLKHGAGKFSLHERRPSAGVLLLPWPLPLRRQGEVGRGCSRFVLIRKTPLPSPSGPPAQLACVRWRANQWFANAPPHPLPSQGREQDQRSEEHTSELQSLMRISYAVFCLKK